MVCAHAHTHTLTYIPPDKHTRLYSKHFLSSYVRLYFHMGLYYWK